MPKTIVYVHPAAGEQQQWSSVKNYLEERGYACTQVVNQEVSNQPNFTATNFPTVVEAYELVAQG